MPGKAQDPMKQQLGTKHFLLGDSFLHNPHRRTRATLLGSVDAPRTGTFLPMVHLFVFALGRWILELKESSSASRTQMVILRALCSEDRGLTSQSAGMPG